MQIVSTLTPDPSPLAGSGRGEQKTPSFSPRAKREVGGLGFCTKRVRILNHDCTYRLSSLTYCLSWRGVRAAEGARLESVCTLTRTAGSNPALSAINIKMPTCFRWYFYIY